ncbi:Replication protein A 70 kDa DNA-binding subunit B [Bienertia sinuspersici]
MAQSINMINDFTPINEIWKIKVRIILFWEVPNYKNPNVVDSIELVLVDEKGSRIQASIRKIIMQRFSNMVKEGWCHIIANFGLISNNGKYRATNHSYKLNFFFKVVVRECEDVQLPLHGLNFTSFAQILKNEIDDSVLVGMNFSILNCNINNVTYIIIKFTRCIYLTQVLLARLPQLAILWMFLKISSQTTSWRLN